MILLRRYKWDMSKFSRHASGYWDNIMNQRSFLNEMAKKLRITFRIGSVD